MRTINSKMQPFPPKIYIKTYIHFVKAKIGVFDKELAAPVGTTV